MPGMRQRLPDGGLALAGVHREAELVVEHAGRRVGVRVRVDARREAEQRLLAHAFGLRHAVEELHLVEVVDDDAADAGVQRLAQLVLGLVVAVEVDALRREADGRRDRQLAAGDDVERPAPPAR